MKGGEGEGGSMGKMRKRRLGRSLLP